MRNSDRRNFHSIMHWVNFDWEVTRQPANRLIQSEELFFLHYLAAGRSLSSVRQIH
jgi:hypothetical protein